MGNDEEVRVVDLIIAVCWVLFWAYWLIAARGTKPGQSRWGRYTGSRVAIIVLVIFLARALGVRSHPVKNDLVLAAVGLALFVLGLALAVWARVYLGRNWGTPMSRKDEPELVTTGPYRRVRHPIYTGLILAITGTALATTLYGLIVAAVLAGFFIYSANREETYLAEQFPDTYPAYKASTKMLIPFIL
jgi:protein-S-isoprenylcysteine O-methyltransferase Ste14